MPFNTGGQVDLEVEAERPQRSLTNEAQPQDGLESTSASTHVEVLDGNDTDTADVEVTQAVHHDEPAATIDTDEAQQLADQQWATFVEQRLLKRHIEGCDKLRPRAVVTTFNRWVPELTEAIRNSGPAQEAIAKGCDIEPDWAKGALVLVGNLMPEDIQEAGIELSAWKYVASEEDDPVVLATVESKMQEIRDRPRQKHTAGKPVIPGSYDVDLMVDCSQSGSGISCTSLVSSSCSEDDPLAAAKEFLTSECCVLNKTFLDLRQPPSPKPQTSRSW